MRIVWDRELERSRNSREQGATFPEAYYKPYLSHLPELPHRRTQLIDKWDSISWSRGSASYYRVAWRWYRYWSNLKLCWEKRVCGFDRQSTISTAAILKRAAGTNNFSFTCYSSYCYILVFTFLWSELLNIYFTATCSIAFSITNFLALFFT